MNERHGERPDRPVSEPAPVITSKARTAEWAYDRRQGRAEPGGVRRMSPLRPDSEPAPTIGAEGLAKGRDRWVLRTGKNTMSTSRDPQDMIPYERDVESPAPTVTSQTDAWKVGPEGSHKDPPHRWKYRNGNRERACERPADEPAPTVHFGAAMNDVKWVEEPPAPTVVTTRRSKDGLLIGRQMADGEGENVGGWGYERPSTAVCGDPRISPPGYRGNPEDYRKNGGKPTRSGDNAVRVTLEEAAILQGFRPDYPFQGSRTAKFTQVGNAVPPPFARAVVAALIGSELAEEAA